MKELVSIVIPIYNMADSINKCMSSVLSQDYKEIEVIIVDDGSEDDSLEICHNIAASDSRIKVIHTENRGSGPARNIGIANASGTYIFFVDADDYIEQNTISILVRAMDYEKYDLVVFGFQKNDNKGNVLIQKTYQNAVFDAEELRQSYFNCMGHISKWEIQGALWNKFFRKSLIFDYNIECPPLKRHQDEGFISRYMCYAKKIHFIPDLLYVHRMNDLEKEYQKYPIDYIDSVIGLKKISEETIVTWNVNDYKTHERVRQMYVYQVIKALELSFSPKMNLSFFERKKWIRNTINKSEFYNYYDVDTLGIYARLIMKFVKKNNMFLLYMILKIRIYAKKMIYFPYLRKKYKSSKYKIQ